MTYLLNDKGVSYREDIIFLIHIRLSFALIFFSTGVLLFADSSGYEALLKSRPPKVQSFDYIEENTPKTDFGYVDFKTLLLFHPAMRMYNFKVNNFFRPLPDKVTVPVKFFLETRERESIKKVKAANLERISLDKKLMRIHKRKSRIANQFAEQKRLLLLDKFADKDLELIELDEKLKVELDKLQNEIKQITSAISKLYDESFGIHYLSVTERKSMLKKIESEVLQIIEIVRQKHQLIFVLNNQVGDLNPAVEANPLSFKYDGFVEMNPLWKFLNRVSNTWSDATEIRIEGDVNLFTEFYSKQQFIGSIFRLDSINRFVISGGLDMTYECLRELYSKYRYPKNQIDNLVNILAELKTEARK